ncbi:MAG: RICIN domain-containing protein, partial [Byssovorax sp.]
MNGNWYPWCVNYGTTNTVTRYKNAWWHVRAKLPQWVKMQLNFNGTDVGGAVDWAAIYPGTTNVDIVLFTNYNRYGLNGDTSWTSFGDSIAAPYGRAMTAGFGNKPFGVSETSSTPDPGDVNRKGKWFVDMANDIVTTHTNIKEVSYFLEDKAMDELRCWDWAYSTADGDPYSPHLSCASGAARAQADRDGIRQATTIMQGGGAGGLPTGTAWYELESEVGELLTGKSADGTDNTRPTAATDGGSWSTQAWKFVDAGGGYYKIQSKYNPALFLTGKNEAGTITPLPINSTAQPDAGLNSQKWQLVSVGGGQYQVKNLSSGGCLSAKDAAGDYTTNYRRAGVHACDSTWTSQRWTLTVQ